MAGTPYNPASLAPQTDDSVKELTLKLAALLYNNATGSVGDAPMLDDDEHTALYKACLLLYGAQQGTVTIAF